MYLTEILSDMNYQFPVEFIFKVKYLLCHVRHTECKCSKQVHVCLFLVNGLSYEKKIWYMYMIMFLRKVQGYWLRHIELLYPAPSFIHITIRVKQNQ